MMPLSSEKSLEFWMNRARLSPSWDRKLSPRWTSLIPHRPTPRQAAFLSIVDLEALYGGAAGGGKSDALLMGALQYVDVPGYSALILRRRLTDACLPGGLLARSHEWLGESGARWDEGSKRWSFASGASLSFGYLEQPSDRYRYQSSEFQFIAFDELTQFVEEEYLYLFSRLRRSKEVEVPLRMRSATNPGGVGHDWVRQRCLVEGRSQGRWFIAARIEDNPYIDQAEYRASLARLDPTTRAQLLEGDWTSGDDGIIAYADIVGCEEETLWEDDFLPTRANELYVGVDVGRTRDRTVIFVWERVGDVFWCRRLDVLLGRSFSEQRQAIERRLVGGVVACVIDKGGIGYQLGEELEAKYPGLVQGLILSPGVQARLAHRLAVAMAEKRVRIPTDGDLRRDFRLVRRPRQVGGTDRMDMPMRVERNIAVETGRSEVGHGDRFWAAAMGLDAAAAVGATMPATLPRSVRPGSAGQATRR
jgi:hypothetical protein